MFGQATEPERKDVDLTLKIIIIKKIEKKEMGMHTQEEGHVLNGVPRVLTPDQRQ